MKLPLRGGDELLQLRLVLGFLLVQNLLSGTWQGKGGSRGGPLKFQAQEGVGEQLDRPLVVQRHGTLRVSYVPCCADR